MSLSLDLNGGAQPAPSSLIKDPESFVVVKDSLVWAAPAKFKKSMGRMVLCRVTVLRELGGVRQSSPPSCRTKVRLPSVPGKEATT